MKCHYVGSWWFLQSSPLSPSCTFSGSPISCKLSASLCLSWDLCSQTLQPEVQCSYSDPIPLLAKCLIILCLTPVNLAIVYQQFPIMRVINIQLPPFMHLSFISFVLYFVPSSLKLTSSAIH
ncbi:uncharacterized protein GGS25DRAFT_145279 [Hypoxylon fragiforme]|uniref:uncharacterized protein n=1 Tax=Hypoxylon fragiforme TaxID=63214 RepID=UPI0020C6AE73|nr:uncharacterized protein GGS25DRAFT_145279 [Hypoxylon fragiforme]KAI2612997.1 hypothetical protein GGS25DRAFT_145279 [Hypoxylon fragiforme]